jgi:hypothetical protein
MPYTKAVKSQDAKAMEHVALELSEQPDADLADYELDGNT